MLPSDHPKQVLSELKQLVFLSLIFFADSVLIRGVLPLAGLLSQRLLLPWKMQWWVHLCEGLDFERREELLVGFEHLTSWLRVCALPQCCNRCPAELLKDAQQLLHGATQAGLCRYERFYFTLQQTTSFCRTWSRSSTTRTTPSSGFPSTRTSSASPPSWATSARPSSCRSCSRFGPFPSFYLWPSSLLTKVVTINSFFSTGVLTLPFAVGHVTRITGLNANLTLEGRPYRSRPCCSLLVMATLFECSLFSGSVRSRGVCSGPLHWSHGQPNRNRPAPEGSSLRASQGCNSLPPSSQPLDSAGYCRY